MQRLPSLGALFSQYMQSKNKKIIQKLLADAWPHILLDATSWAIFHTCQERLGNDAIASLPPVV